jgi:hypothetical protein
MASKSTGTLPGFTRLTGPSDVGGTKTSPGGFVIQDTAGNDWYLWVGSDGKWRTTEAATAEAPGFAWNSGGTVVGTQS